MRSEAQREAEETVERANLGGFAYLKDMCFGMNRRPIRDELFDIEWQRRDGGHY